MSRLEQVSRIDGDQVSYPNFFSSVFEGIGLQYLD